MHENLSLKNEENKNVHMDLEQSTSVILMFKLCDTLLNNREIILQIKGDYIYQLKNSSL